MRPCCVGGTTPWCTATSWQPPSSKGKSCGTEDPAPTNDNQPPPRNLARPPADARGPSGPPPVPGGRFRPLFWRHIPAAMSGAKFRCQIVAASSCCDGWRQSPVPDCGGIFLRRQLPPSSGARLWRKVLAARSRPHIHAADSDSHPPAAFLGAPSGATGNGTIRRAQQAAHHRHPGGERSKRYITVTLGAELRGARGITTQRWPPGSMFTVGSTGDGSGNRPGAGASARGPGPAIQRPGRSCHPKTRTGPAIQKTGRCAATDDHLGMPTGAGPAA